MLMAQCQGVTNTNATLAKENHRAKVMVKTLEAVVMLLYTSRSENSGPSSTESVVDVKL
jgi:hypothetical protein